ncbi:MAG: methyltransferase, TrmH family, group 1 [Gammaproteobacteria bacterium]|jgi:TrmH family RNA methyltransferase|nr:methyltransferase, TrmH family, group 1 [Gammaproteobacteria bacterium]
MNFENITIILVNPSHPGNIGACARAMKTMGLSQMRLVKPRREVDADAIARSAGAEEILYQAQYFDDLKTAIADCQLVIGTSARQDVPDVIDLSFREAASIAVEAVAERKVALVFGREHAGLNNDELALCQYHAYIPANPEFSSLNLGAAVQVMCYEVFLASQNISKPVETRLQDAYATQHEIELLFAHFEKTLADINFYDPNNPRRLMPKLRAMFNRTQLLKSEVAILRGILTAVDAK